MHSPRGQRENRVKDFTSVGKDFSYDLMAANCKGGPVNTESSKSFLQSPLGLVGS